MTDITCRSEPGQINPTPAQFPLEDLKVDFLRRLKTLQEKHYLRRELSPYNFRAQFTDELLTTIASASTVARYLGEESPDYYAMIEVYRSVTQHFIDRIRSKAEHIKNHAVGRRKERLEEHGVKIKGVPMRSFHGCDNSGDSIRALSKAINMIEGETGSSVSWQYIASYTSTRSEDQRTEHIKNSQHWTKEVEGCGYTPANIRAWSNKIVMAIKCADVVVALTSTLTSTHTDTLASALTSALTDTHTTHTTLGGIIFALRTTTEDGCAIVELLDFTSPACISAIHLFSQSFVRAEIVCTIASDRLFLCGSRFRGLSAKTLKGLVEFSEIGKDDLSLFSAEYMAGEDFTKTVEILCNVYRETTAARYENTEKLLSIHSQLVRSVSGRLMQGHIKRVLDDEYPDTSSQWYEKFGVSL
jgi:hypothetical protein